jgi:hypothetical protein
MRKPVFHPIAVLPLTAQVARDRTALHRLGPVELEAATFIAAVKRVRADIREGRLGH